MKNLLFGAVLVIGTMATSLTAKASVDVVVNISSQPLWGPVGYDYVEYYYLPDLEVYYYVPAHKWVYLNGGRWIFATYLPYRYRDYDLYTTYKVVINEPRPYRYFYTHRAVYAGYRGGPHHQVFIRNSNNPKYFVVKGHPHYRGGNFAAHPNHSRGNYFRPAAGHNNHFRPSGMRNDHYRAFHSPAHEQRASHFFGPAKSGARSGAKVFRSGGNNSRGGNNAPRNGGQHYNGGGQHFNGGAAVHGGNNRGGGGMHGGGGGGHRGGGHR